jgi:hypothetical protein
MATAIMGASEIAVPPTGGKPDYSQKTGLPGRTAPGYCRRGLTPCPVKGEFKMKLIQRASVALVLGVAVAMSAVPAGAATVQKHKVVKVQKAPHYKNLFLGFLEAVFHPVDHDKDKK